MDKAREAARNNTKSKNNKERVLSEKLAKATGRDYKHNELFLVEGDSAGGSAKSYRDREHQAILPLRGKVINADKASSEDLFKNEEINTLIYTIGAGVGQSFDASESNYDKVIIMTDADVDGYQIRTLILTMLYRLTPTLKVEWKKVNCSGYEITYTTDSKFKKGLKKVRIKNPKTVKKAIKKLKKNKKYYVKVRAYTDYNGVRYYGDRSTMLSSYYSNVYATYYSYYVNNKDRTTNLKIASKKINGTIIQPGETFDFNKVVGSRTAAKGYKKAHVFTGENSTTMGLAGGICQVASTVFNTALISNVKIVERHQHSQRVSYVPLGRDAAISGNVQNFRWKNNTKYAIKIKMTVKGGKITCTFYTCQKVKPKKVKLKVTQKGKTFTLKRSVKGKTNYSCKSKY